MADGTVHIGTSGWHYRHWIGPFYPDGTSPDDFFAWYAGNLGSVEINDTFCQLPQPAVLAEWCDRTPRGFVFACKASRYITHMKKLKDPTETTARFFAAIVALGDKLEPILFQLPPPAGISMPIGSRGFSTRCRRASGSLSSFGTKAGSPRGCSSCSRATTPHCAHTTLTVYGRLCE
jgi:hypothetical protein